MNTSYDIDFELIGEESRSIVDEILDLSLLDIEEVDLF